MNRRQLAALVAILLLLGLLAWWWASEPNDVQTDPILGRAAAAPRASSSITALQQAQVVPLLPASAASGLDPQLAPDWELSPAGLLESREWCTQAVRRARLEDESEQRAELQPEALQLEAEPDPVLEQAQRRALLRWARHLKAEGDDIALALADYLLDSVPLAQPGARERLLLRAQGSQQGLVISLGLQRCTGDKDCEAQLARRWTKVEPDNAAAWQYSVGHRPLSEVMGGLQGAVRRQDHLQPVMERLLALPQAPNAGLRDAAELQLLQGAWAGWSLPVWSPVIRHCQELPQPSECPLIAERMWKFEDPWLLNRLLTLRLAGDAGRRDPRWQARAEVAEGLAQWGRERPDVERNWMRTVAACDPSHAAGPRLRAVLAESEWPRLFEELRRQKTPLAELAERRRQRNGRSLLDPPAPKP